jgi:hypothetical protein
VISFMNARVRVAIIWFAVVSFLIIFAATASKPLHLDNMDFPAVAEAVAQRGIPIYYRGEQNSNHLGLFHPPLYIYLLALWFKIIGAGPAQARLFGAVCALIQGMCVLLLIKELFGQDFARRAASWFWVVFLLNAYTVQTAGIADIDSTIYGPLILIYLWTIIRLSWLGGVWRSDPIAPAEIVLVVLALVLCLWAKLTTIWLVLPFVFFLLVSRLGWLGATRLSVTITLAGSLGFLVTYWAYGRLLHLPVDFTFSFTWMSFLKRGSSGRSGLGAWLDDRWRNLQFMLPFTVKWTGLVPWVGILAATGYGMWWWVRTKDRRILHAVLLLLLAGLSTLYYCGQVTTFGGAPFKYTFVYWGVVVAGGVVAALPEKGGLWPAGSRSVVACAALWVAAAVAGLELVQDKSLLNPADTVALKWSVLAPAVVFTTGLLLRVRGQAYGGSVLTTCALLVYGGLQTGIAIYQNSRDYATTYDYGQIGFVDTVGYVRTHTLQDDLIVSMKDIGYAARRRYFANYAAVYGEPSETKRLMELMVSGTAKLAIFTENHGQDQLIMNPPLRDWVTRNCRLLACFGDYRIYGGCKVSSREPESPPGRP